MKKKILLGAFIAATFLTTAREAQAGLFDWFKKDKTEKTAKANTQGEYTISKKPMELTIFSMASGKILDPTWPVYKQAAEDTNITLNNVVSKNMTDQLQAFNLMVASGDLPDIISMQFPDELEKLGLDGGLLPLNDLIDKHAPNLKAFFEKYPRYFKDTKAADGNIYIIPDYYDWYNLRTAQGLFIRQDWLDKLGLERPNTVEEMYNVFKAFREQDPNGNGLKDEIPYFDRTTVLAAKELLGLLGGEISFYTEGKDVKFGPLEPAFKEAVKEAAKWYEEGLVDPELFTRGFKARDYLLMNNLGGSTIDWFASTSSYNTNQAVIDNNKDFAFKPMAPIEVNGKRIIPDARPTFTAGWSISATTKNPVEAIKYFDYWFSERGRTLTNWGIEGVTYEVVNGEKKLTDEILNSGSNPLDAIKVQTGGLYLTGTLRDAEVENMMIKDQDTKDMIKEYMANGYVPELMPRLKYNDEERKEIYKLQADIKTYVDEMVQKWILGSGDIDTDFAKFEKRLKDLGIEEALDINNAAYGRYLGN